MNRSAERPKGDDSVHEECTGGHHDSCNDQAIESGHLDSVATGGTFLAAWVSTNFPGITSEVDLISKVRAHEQTKCIAPQELDTNWSSQQERYMCEECCAFIATFHCQDCNLALCIRCTDAIHIIPSLSTHSIGLYQSSSSSNAPDTHDETRLEAAVPSVIPAQEVPLHIASARSSEHQVVLRLGTSIFFRAPDCSRWSRELLHGTIVNRESATTWSGKTLYHRVLWLRGVEALPNGFYRAALLLPGWDMGSGNQDEAYWPHEIGVFSTQLGALRAVATAEQVARAKFRRELAAGRIHRRRRFELEIYNSEQHPEDDEIPQETFPSCQILDEIVVESAARLSSEFGVLLTRQEDARFHQEVAQGTWSFHNWMATIKRLTRSHEDDAASFECGMAGCDMTLEDGSYNDEIKVPMPWSPATRMRFFMVAQHAIISCDDVRRHHLRVILDQLLFVYAGFAWRLWRQYVQQHREREEQRRRERAACVIQAWIQWIGDRNRERKRKCLGLAIGPIDALELYRRRQIEARKLYAFFTRQIQERKAKVLKLWRVAIGPSTSLPPAATTWHPSHGMKTMFMLPKLPRIGARRRTAQDKLAAPSSQIVIEDKATYKLFCANHVGPADTSYWVIRGRVLFGACPIGPAFREARRLVSRTDFAMSVLLQQISVFVCLMETQELRRMEEAAGTSSNENEWSFERQIRTRHQALCVELKNAEAIGKRHVELAQQSLSEFDAQADHIAVAAREDVGSKDAAAEKTTMNEARKALKQKLRLATEQLTKASNEVARLGMMQIEFVYFPIVHDGVPDDSDLINFLEEHVESRLRAGKNLYIFSRLGHGRTGLVSALLLGRVYGITALEALERAQRTHDCQRPGAPRGTSYCSPTTTSQVAFVRRVLARSIDPIYAPLVLENSTEGFRSTRMQQRGLLAEPYLRDEGFMVSGVADDKTRERETLEHKRLERIARRESSALALLYERRRQRREHDLMEIEEFAQTAHGVMTKTYDEVLDDNRSNGS